MPNLLIANIAGADGFRQEDIKMPLIRIPIIPTIDGLGFRF